MGFALANPFTRHTAAAVFVESRTRYWYDWAMYPGAALRLVALGQALIGHDLRGDPWPGLAALAAILARADLCFTDLEQA